MWGQPPPAVRPGAAPATHWEPLIPPLLAQRTREKWGTRLFPASSIWESKVEIGPDITSRAVVLVYPRPMPWGLKRYYGTGGLHFITCSCFGREPVLGTPERRDLLLTVLEQMRQRYRFVVVGYVVMPEHLHLLISEPEVGNPSTVMQAVKLGFARRVLDPSSKQKPHPSTSSGQAFSQSAREMEHPAPHHIWQRRFYDFNLWSQRKEVEKLRYMHRNPVERGLVQRPEEWRWSSFLAYACGENGPVRINDWSCWERRMRAQVS